jgi:hypothetical protein
VRAESMIPLRIIRVFMTNHVVSNVNSARVNERDA